MSASHCRWCGDETVLAPDDTWVHRADGSAWCNREDEPVEPRPEIIVLCGSTRFYTEFTTANYELTLAGKIVLSVGFFMHAPNLHGEGVGITPEQKVELDELHKRKIDLADSVHVLNVNGYIGESTRSEIEYATRLGKPVTYLERPSRATVR